MLWWNSWVWTNFDIDCVYGHLDLFAYFSTWYVLWTGQHQGYPKKTTSGEKKAETIQPLISSYDRQWLTPLLGEGGNGVTYEPIHVPSLFASNQKDITQIKLSLLTLTTLFNHYFATATHYFSLFWSTSSTLKFWFIAGLDVLLWNFWVWINFENGCAYPHEFVCVFSNMMCFMDEHAL